MDNQPPRERENTNVSNITERGFVDPEQLTDGVYASDQLDRWQHPATIKLTPIVMSELQILDESKSFRVAQKNKWKTRLIELMKQEEQLEYSLGDRNPYKHLFNEAYGFASTPEQQQALSVVERLSLVASGPIATKESLYPESNVIELIKRILAS